MNKTEFILATVFLTMGEILIVLGIIGHQPDLFVLASIYLFPIWICYYSGRFRKQQQRLQ